MRRFSLIASAAVLVAIGSWPAEPALAQQRTSAASTRLRDYGLFAGLDLRFGDVMGEFGAIVGGHAAILLKNRVYLGVTGAGLATDNAEAAPTPGGEPVPIRMGYGGILLGSIVPTPSLLHATIDVLIGAGGVRVRAEDDISGGDVEDDAVFVFEPTATVEVKLAPFARIGVGVSYRFVGDLDVPGIRDKDLRGVAGVVTIRAGKF